MPRIPSRRSAVALVPLLALFATAIAAAGGAPGTVSFTSAAYEVDEGAGKATLTLTRTGGVEGPLMAKVSLADVTAGPDDYQGRPGSLDTTYAAASPSPHFYYYQGMALQPDGKLVLGGFDSPLKRLNTDGTVDGSFKPPAFNSPVEAVALQPDGKVIVTGSFTGIPGMTRVARLNPDGSPDSSFNVGVGPDSDPIAVAVQPDGKIVIGGYFTSVNLKARQHIARLNSDGSLDETFNAAASNCYALAIQADGKILAGTPFLERFNADGSRDESIPYPRYFAFAISPRPDGTVIFGGTLRGASGATISKGVYRLHSDGSLDTSFVTGAGTDGGISALAVQPDGKIIAGGSGMGVYNGTTVGNLIRLNPDGDLDPSFQPGPLTGSISQVILQPDGKVIANGNFTARTQASLRTNFARFNGDLWINWAAGDGADKTVSVPISEDLLDEPDETADLSVTVFAPGAAGAIPSATLSISDNDVPPAFTSAPPSQAVTRVTYTHTFTAGGAPAPRFSLISGALPAGFSFTSAGVLSGTPSTPGVYSGITVMALNGVMPAATQTFDLVVADGGAFRFDSSAYSVGENGGAVTVTVDRVGGSAGTATVNYSAAGNTATAGTDFSLPTGTLTFADGETSKTFSVTVNDDQVNERDETVSLFLNQAGGSGKLGSPAFATLTITNDDPLPSISVDDVTVIEGDAAYKTANFTITRSGLIDRTVSFTARTADGTALAGEDYATLNGQYQIGPGVNSTTVSVTLYNDTIIEGNKSFSLALSSPVNATLTRAQGVCEIQDNDTSTGVPTVQFSSREVTVQEGAGSATLTVTRSGDASAPTTVNYGTALWLNMPVGAASDRNDYTYRAGTLRFAAGETAKTIQVLITDDVFTEGDEVFPVTLSGPTGGTILGTPASTSVRIIDNDAAPSAQNPSDDPAFFVRQHYRDFLGRDPDAEGLAHWTNEIEQCGADQQCREVRRVNVSAAFFLSIEFQETGYFVYLLHKAAFNAGERLGFGSFMYESQQVGNGLIVGAEGWQQQMASNKEAFAVSLAASATFSNAYPQAMTPEQFVDALNANTGDPLNPTAGGALSKSERDRLAADLASGAMSRAQVLRAVAENAEYRRRQSNKAFVLMQYFGYMRRAPNAFPDSNFDGYNYWLGKLNEFRGNFVEAEMVRAFIASDEYRKRFGQ